MKPIIFCIVGESGSGKTMVAEALEKYADIPLIQSYTDRPKRTPTENGHTFLSKEEFDLLKEEDMIARTEWSGYRYCCLTSDVKPVNAYIIDCRGLEMLKEKYSEKYCIVSILIKRNKNQRIKSVGRDRVDRDEGKFYLPDEYYDKVIYNDTEKKLNIIFGVWSFVREFLLTPEYLSEKEYSYCIGTENELSE